MYDEDAIAAHDRVVADIVLTLCSMYVSLKRNETKPIRRRRRRCLARGIRFDRNRNRNRIERVSNRNRYTKYPYTYRIPIDQNHPIDKFIDRFRATDDAFGGSAPRRHDATRRDAFDAVRTLRARGGDDVLRGGWCVISKKDFFRNVPCASATRSDRVADAREDGCPFVSALRHPRQHDRGISI